LNDEPGNLRSFNSFPNPPRIRKAVDNEMRQSMKNFFVLIILAGFVLGVVMGCATSKPQLPKPKLEVIIIFKGIKNYYYCDRFEESKKNSEGNVIYRFLDKDGNLTAKVTIVPNTKVLINDYSK
jgi:hypothetical protein